ncbi:MAG: CpXC domain-containing protein [Alphaproteobacteria bacterium]|nr:CpXC domain-containing protein [Alphaproteobacteria bacterium]
MSVFHQAIVECTNCGTENGVEIVASVNADRRPDLRDAILDGSFQAVKCESCGTALRLPAHMTYLDVARGQWLLVDAFSALPNWKAAEAEAQGAYDLAFGADAPAEAREIGEGLSPRLVFGWPALREKLIAGDLGLDDTMLELLKMSLIANVPGPPAADETELRLIGGDTETLRFAWIVGSSEQQIASLDVPRSTYDEIMDDADDWEEARAALAGHLFIDVKRLLSGPGEKPARLELPAA